MPPKGGIHLSVGSVSCSICLVFVAAGCGEEDEGGGGGSGESSATGGSTAEARDVLQIRAGELTVDMAKYCGDKPFTLGVIDGFGENAWRVERRALLEQEAAKCPNLEEVKYFTAQLDPQRYHSTLNSWTAQGVDVIVTFPDFGQASVPQFRRARTAGRKDRDR